MRASSLFPLLALATSVLLLVDVASAAKTKSGSKDDSAGVDKETVQMMMDRLEQVSGVFTGGHKPRASTRGERAGWVLVDDETLAIGRESGELAVAMPGILFVGCPPSGPSSST